MINFVEKKNHCVDKNEMRNYFFFTFFWEERKSPRFVWMKKTVYFWCFSVFV
jgi:hypothetical protein